MKTYIHRKNVISSKWVVDHFPGSLVTVFPTSMTSVNPASLAMLLVPVDKDKEWGTMYLALLNDELVHIEDGAYELVSNS